MLGGSGVSEHEIEVEDRAFLLRILPYQVGADTAGVVLALIDITQRKHIENALRASETRLSTIIKTAVDAIVTIDESGIVQSFNPSAEKIFGWRSDEMVVAEEGCLSVPAIYDSVPRHARVKVRALGRDGEPFELEAGELLAVCVQHEMDHLLGKVFVDYLSALKRSRIRTKLLKRQRERQRA